MGWGFGISVCTRRTRLGPSVETYGGPGFPGTGARRRPEAADVGDFWNAVYQAIDD
jgi:hypothetical protein